MKWKLGKGIYLLASVTLLQGCEISKNEDSDDRSMSFRVIQSCQGRCDLEVVAEGENEEQEQDTDKKLNVPIQ